MSIQFKTAPHDSSKLIVLIHGRSTVTDASTQFTTILKKINGFSKIVFDLTKIDPVNNIAGRYIDLAAAIQKNHKVLIEIPENVAFDIQSFTADNKPSKIEGVPIKLTHDVTPITEITPVAALNEQNGKITFSCVGKVRAVREKSITVSFFNQDEETVGEIFRDQFPSGDVSPGTVFEYKAVITGNGRTEIQISFPAMKRLSTNEILELYNEISASLPGNDS
jgi:hypothetical protein